MFSDSDNGFQPETLQQKLAKNGRKIVNHVYLPGFGSFTPSSAIHYEKFERPERQVGLKEAFSFDLIDDTIDIGYEEKEFPVDSSKTNAKDVEEISPVLVTVSETEPNAALKLFDDDIYNDSNG